MTEGDHLAIAARYHCAIIKISMEKEEPNITQESESGSGWRKRILSKKFLTVAIVCIVIISIALIVSLILLRPATENLTKKPTSSSPASIYFLSDSVNINSVPEERTVDLIVNSSSFTVTGLTLYLVYEPEYIEIKKFNLNNLDDSFFGNYVQIKDLWLAEPAGRTLISLAIPDDIPAKSGIGGIGTITFEVKNLNPGDSTSINISPDSSFITPDGSIIPYTARPLPITFPLSQTTDSNIAPDAQQRLQQQTDLIQSE